MVSPLDNEISLEGIFASLNPLNSMLIKMQFGRLPKECLPSFRASWGQLRDIPLPVVLQNLDRPTHIDADNIFCRTSNFRKFI